MANFKNQSIRDLIFNPLFYLEYPYHWVDEKGMTVFSKKPRYNWGILEIIEIKEKIKKVSWRK